VRYYVYASDAKIDMLYSQIPRKLLDRFVSELDLDRATLDVPLRRRESEATLFGKLAVVERFVEREFEVGSVREPAIWLRGAMPLRWGVYRERQDGLLYFSGLQDGVLLALIGSAHHQIGQGGDPAAIQGPRYSSAPALFALLAREEPDAPAADPHEDDDRRAMREVKDFTDALAGVRQPCEFVARRLLRGAAEDASGAVREILLATPLYVALADA
jgi:hypothetical protein